MSNQAGRKEFTGRHMLLLMLAFFGVIISVNMVMALLAMKSWTGLIVRNPYVASQQFNERVAEARAQASLGWHPELEIADGVVTYRITDGSGRAVSLGAVTIRLNRPVGTRNDTLLKLERGKGGLWHIAHRPGEGIWIMSIEAEAGLDHPFRDIRRISIHDGALR
jgi:nitrogen fixation protein FixH